MPLENLLVVVIVLFGFPADSYWLGIMRTCIQKALFVHERI